MGVVIIFIDGIGLAPAGESNPLSAGTAFLRRWLPGPGLTAELFAEGGDVWKPGDGVCVARIDACLGVEGLPQSATGQTALFTGCNAPRRLGKHLSGFPGPTLLRMLAESSVFRRAVERGYKVTFANPFPAGYLAAVATRRRRHATTTAAILAAGVPLRSFRDLEAGRAVSHDLTGEMSRRRGFASAPSTPEGSGRRLAALALTHDLVLFEYFLTDRAGHARDSGEAREHLDKLGRFIEALTDALPLERHTVLIVSDHGNMEDLSVPTHTRNPVPAVGLGARADVVGEMDSLLDIAPGVLRALERGAGPKGSQAVG